MKVDRERKDMETIINPFCNYFQHIHNYEKDLDLGHELNNIRLAVTLAPRLVGVALLLPLLSRRMHLKLNRAGARRQAEDYNSDNKFTSHCNAAPITL